MTHQETVDFVISVYEAKIYSTHILAGFKVTRTHLGWALVDVS